MNTSHATRIAIVGGGIGGLTAANALLSRGLDVTLYERAPALGEIGAGVTLTPNGVRALEKLGFTEALGRAAVRFDASRSSFFRSDGTPAAPIVTSDDSGWSGMSGIHRADLLSALAGALPDGVIRTGRNVVDFRQDEHGAELTFVDGTTASADAVIAADGISSTLQKFVLGTVTPPVFSGHIAYRGLLPAEKLDIPNDAMSFWMGSGRHFMCYPVRHGEFLNYVGFVSSDQRAAESWSAEGDPDDLRAAFAGWDPRVGHILSQVTKVFWWGVYDREPFPHWSKGRLTLLGDAAHPMRPHQGQGGNQAIEDAVALSVILEGVAPEDIPAALRHYEQLRRERTARCQAESRRMGEELHAAPDSGLDDRDAWLAESAAARRALYSYDAEDAARAFTAQLATSGSGS